MTAKLTSAIVLSTTGTLDSIVSWMTMPVARLNTLAVNTGGLRMLTVSPTFPEKSPSKSRHTSPPRTMLLYNVARPTLATI